MSQETYVISLIGRNIKEVIIKEGVEGDMYGDIAIQPFAQRGFFQKSTYE